MRKNDDDWIEQRNHHECHVHSGPSVAHKIPVPVLWNLGGKYSAGRHNQLYGAARSRSMNREKEEMEIGRERTVLQEVVNVTMHLLFHIKRKGIYLSSCLSVLNALLARLFRHQTRKLPKAMVMRAKTLSCRILMMSLVAAGYHYEVLVCVEASTRLSWY
jgi:hypothetical protein